MGPRKLRTHFQIPPAPQLFLVVNHFRADPSKHLRLITFRHSTMNVYFVLFLEAEVCELDNYQSCIKCYWGKVRIISSKNTILTPFPVPSTPPLLKPKKHSSGKAERGKYPKGLDWMLSTKR